MKKTVTLMLVCLLVVASLGLTAMAAPAGVVLDDRVTPDRTENFVTLTDGETTYGLEIAYVRAENVSNPLGWTRPNGVDVNPYHPGVVRKTVYKVNPYAHVARYVSVEEGTEVVLAKALVATPVAETVVVDTVSVPTTAIRVAKEIDYPLGWTRPNGVDVNPNHPGVVRETVYKVRPVV